MHFQLSCSPDRVWDAIIDFWCIILRDIHLAFHFLCHNAFSCKFQERVFITLLCRFLWKHVFPLMSEWQLESRSSNFVKDRQKLFMMFRFDETQDIAFLHFLLLEQMVYDVYDHIYCKSRTVLTTLSRLSLIVMSISKNNSLRFKSTSSIFSYVQV